MTHKNEKNNDEATKLKIQKEGKGKVSIPTIGKKKVWIMDNEAMKIVSKHM